MEILLTFTTLKSILIRSLSIKLAKIHQIKNLICFDYTITNKTDKDINAIDGWQAVFNAYQDNKNTEGKLQVGALPPDTSEKVLDIQDQTIKKGGTVKCRASYELASTSKLVVLKATKGDSGKYLGKKVYYINKLHVGDSNYQDNQSQEDKAKPNTANHQTVQSTTKRSNTQQNASQSSNVQEASQQNNNQLSNKAKTGDWDNQPELWSDVQNDNNYKGSMYENATPQERYDYIASNADRWSSIEASNNNGQ